jgi:hypothetical protein
LGLRNGRYYAAKSYGSGKGQKDQNIVQQQNYYSLDQQRGTQNRNQQGLSLDVSKNANNYSLDPNSGQRRYYVDNSLDINKEYSTKLTGRSGYRKNETEYGSI